MNISRDVYKFLFWNVASDRRLDTPSIANAFPELTPKKCYIHSVNYLISQLKANVIVALTEVLPSYLEILKSQLPKDVECIAQHYNTSERSFLFVVLYYPERFTLLSYSHLSLTKDGNQIIDDERVFPEADMPLKRQEYLERTLGDNFDKGVLLSHFECRITTL